MRLAKNQSGMAVLELVVIVALVAVIGFAGYRVYSANNSANETYDTISQTSSPTPVATGAPAINSASDLDTAAKAIDQVNPDDNNSDASQLDNQLAGF